MEWLCHETAYSTHCIYRVKLDKKVVLSAITLYGLHTSKLAENYVTVCRIRDKEKQPDLSQTINIQCVSNYIWLILQ